MATFPVDEDLFCQVASFSIRQIQPPSFDLATTQSEFYLLCHNKPQATITTILSCFPLPIHQRMSGTKVLVLKTIFVAVSSELRRITDHLTGAEPRFSKQLALTFSYNKHMCQGRERVRVSITHGTMAISEIAVHIAITLAPWVYLMVPRTASWLGSCFQGFLLP
jgi:hypothetical protein